MKESDKDIILKELEKQREVMGLIEQAFLAQIELQTIDLDSADWSRIREKLGSYTGLLQVVSIEIHRLINRLTEFDE